MTDTLDTYIKSPAPPRNPDAQYVYTEQQFSSLEKALRKHHDKILEVDDNSQALYEAEVLARATADEAIVQTIETLTATVAAGDASNSSQIQNIQTALVDAESSTATRLSTLETKVDTGDAQNRALIAEEAKTRTTKVDSLASKVSNLEAGVKTLTSDTRALIRTEQTARVTEDTALATSIATLDASVDTAVASLNAAISNEATVRANADTAEANARTALSSYVGWNGGSYSSNLTQSLETKVSKTDGASYAWAIQGNIDGVTGGLRLAGAKRLNPSTNQVETTTNLIIDANTTINGSLVVNGTITGQKIGTGSNGVDNANIVSNAVSNSAYAQGGNTASASIALRAGSRVSILANYAGGDGLGFNATTGTLQVLVNGGAITNNSITIRPSGAGVGVTQAFVSGVLVLTSAFQSYASSPTALLTFYQAPSDGTYTVSANASSGFGQTVSLLVIELSK